MRTRNMWLIAGLAVALVAGCCGVLAKESGTGRGGGGAEKTPVAEPLTFQWGESTLLSDDGNRAARTAQRGFSIATDGDRVHAIYQSVISRENGEVYYRRSDDGGLTWGTPQRLTHHEGRAMAPNIAVKGDDVYCVWRDTRFDQDGELYFIRSTDGGDSWEGAVRLTEDDVRTAAPNMAVVGDSVTITWEDYGMANKRSDVEILRSADAGRSWKPRQSVIEAVNGCPILAVGEGDVLNLVSCSWDHSKPTEGYNFELYFRRSEDGGASWTAPRRLTDDETGDSRFPVIAASGRTLHVAWWDDRDDDRYPHRGYPPISPPADHNFEVYYKRSDDMGETWSEDTRLTNSVSVASNPAIVSKGSRVFIVWEDNRDGGNAIFFKYSTDDGLTWSEDIRLTDPAHEGIVPGLAVGDDGALHLIWTEKRDGPPRAYVMRGLPSGG